MFASGKKTVNQRKHIVYKHVVHGQGSKGLIFRASDTVGRGKKVKFHRIFRDKFKEKSADFAGISWEFSGQTWPKSNW